MDLVNGLAYLNDISELYMKEMAASNVIKECLRLLWITIQNNGDRSFGSKATYDCSTYSLGTPADKDDLVLQL